MISTQVGAHADLVVATVAAPLPGLDYHVHDALFLGESKIWAVLEALLDDFGAAPAFAALGVGNLRADLCGSNLQPDFNVRVDAAAGAVGAVRRLFPRLERYRATVAADAARDGFVETLLGKRRALPRITDADRKKRSRAERQALSTAVQGSAADLVKRAMAETVAAFADRPPATKPHLVIQLHDELIFETPEAAAASNAALVATALEAGLDDVPTRVKLKVGPTWADLEDL